MVYTRLRKFLSAESLLFVFSLLFLIVNNIVNWGEGPYPFDDRDLFDQPFLKIQDWQSFKTIFTFGNHVDFYPIRDLTVWLDWMFSTNMNEYYFVPRVQNFIWFVLTAIAFIHLLKKFNIESKIATLLIATWMIHPVHLESLNWASARKDHLAFLFILTSAICYLNSNANRRLFWGSLSVVFFIFSGLSKATFLFIPLGLLSFVLLCRIQKHPPDQNQNKLLNTPLLQVLSFTSICLIVIQFINYSGNNDMYMQFDFSYRLTAVAAAVGRYFLGTFWYQFNTLELAPWGAFWKETWYSIPIGISLLAAGTVHFLFSIQRRKWKTLCFYFLLFSLLLATPGFNPSHRNFYSVRYFEPILALILCFLLSEIRATSRIKFAVLMTYSILIFQTYIDSKNWESFVSIMDKTLTTSPSNLTAQKNKLTGLLELQKWGKTSASENVEITELFASLKAICLQDRPPISCYSFLATFPDLTQTPTLSLFAEDFIKAASGNLYLTKQLTPQLFEETKSLELFYQHLKLPVLIQNLPEISQQKDIPSRIISTLKSCFLHGPKTSLGLIENKVAAHLLDKKIIAQWIENTNSSKENHLFLVQCLYK